METHRRSLAKSLSWRFFATIITTVVTLVITGEIATAAAVGAFDTVIKFLVYYGHERLWVFISFGKPKPPDYEI